MNYNSLDVDKNLIIDHMDEQCVLAKVMGWSYSSQYFSRATQKYSTAPSTSGFTAHYDNASNVARTYMRYSYTQKKQMANYDLNPSTESIYSSTSNKGMERVIIGSDDRYLAKGSENTGIVRLCLNSEGDSGGTGFIVGEHEIAVAAHCVYNAGTYSWKDLYCLNTYNENGEMTNTKLTPVEVHVPLRYKRDPNVYDFRFDYALITVKEDLSNYYQFDLGTSYNVNIANFANIPIYTTGCSQTTLNGSINTLNHLYSSEGRVISDTNTAVLRYDADTIGGNSGGPVYTITMNVVNNKPSYSYTVLAIHDGGNNSGSLITKYHLQFYKSNPYANH